MKTAIICIARNENLYIREWVEHHLRLGFDKIIVCDNGFGNEESPLVALGGLEKSVEILDWRNRKYVQPKCYTECYSKYRHSYDWLAFFDCDEFMILEKDQTIQGFLNRFPRECQLVSVNWETMTDNNLLTYDSRPLMERFTEPMERNKFVQYDFPENRHTKSIVRGGLPSVVFTNPHTPSTRLVSYHSNLKKEPQGYYHNIDYSYVKLRHFTTKTIEEWCTIKVPRGRVDSAGAKVELERFFKYNEKTNEKISIMKKFFPETKMREKPSLTVLGVCSPDKKQEMENLVREEARKLDFLKPQMSIAEIKCGKSDFWYAFNKFCICEMHNSFDTDFALIVQFDGRILNPSAWTDEFFNYDYIGAPWGDKVVGNGGFCLRSRKLCEFVSRELGQKWKDRYSRYVNVSPDGHEDVFYCRHERRFLESKGFKFAPFEVARKFSVEHGVYSGQLGAHNSFSFNGTRYSLKNISKDDFKSIFQKTSIETMKTETISSKDICVCTYSVGEESNYKASITNPFKIAYCNKMGYDYCFCTWDCQGPPTWQKIKAVEKLLGTYKYVVWMDSDCAPVNFDVKLEDLVKGKDKDFLIERDPISLNGKEWYMNAGFFICRDSDWTRKFLVEWWRRNNGSIKDPVQDQYALNQMYGSNWGDMQSHTFLWPKLTLQPVHPRNYKPGMFLKHCAATKASDFHARWWENLDEKMFAENWKIQK